MPKAILFKNVKATIIMEVIGSLFDHQKFPVLIDLIGLITSTDFNRLSIDLKLVIINFRISADSQP